MTTLNVNVSASANTNASMASPGFLGLPGSGSGVDDELRLRLSQFRQAAFGNDLTVRVHGAQPAGNKNNINNRNITNAEREESTRKTVAFVKSVVLGASLMTAGLIGLGLSNPNNFKDSNNVNNMSNPVGPDTGPQKMGASASEKPSAALAPSSLSSPSSPSAAKGVDHESSLRAKPLVVDKSDGAVVDNGKTRSEGLKIPLKYVNVTYAGEKTKTLDVASRIRLSKAAAKNAGLADVGLNWTDVYGVIHAETSWVSRAGMGRNGIVSSGLAQFEPGTAKGLGLDNPNDPVQAVYASAILIKHAALWTKKRIGTMNLDADRAHSALREGVSVYYNLGTKSRHAWKPDANELKSQRNLPTPTLAHIQNVEDGASMAEAIEKDLIKQGLVMAKSEKPVGHPVTASSPPQSLSPLLSPSLSTAPSSLSPPLLPSRITTGRLNEVRGLTLVSSLKRSGPPAHQFSGQKIRPR